jgi:rare lipoprotein A
VKKPTQKAYSVNGKVYYPKKEVPIGWTQRGIASWYGPNFHGKYTSNGEVYNMFAYTAAHKTLPMDTVVKVTNLNNHKSVIVRINDRGPFVKGRIIDLSYAAGKKIGLDRTGTAPVVLKVVGFKGKNYVSGYMIQVGAFMRKSGAEKTAKKYRRIGYNTKVLKMNGFYKVFITGFKSYNDAKKFKLEHKLSGFIVGE